MPGSEAGPLWPWAEASDHGVAVALTTRHGGVSQPPYDTLNLGLHVGDEPVNVLRNRSLAAAAFGVTLDTMVFAQQVHGAAASLVGPADGGSGARAEGTAVPGTDFLVTTTPRLTLAIMVADCVPLALVDRGAGVLAAVHAGWRGTAGGAVGHAVDAMRVLGARPEDMYAFLGPAVAPDRYQVTDDVVDALARAVPDSLEPGVARADGPGHWRVDLVAANLQQLASAGVRAECLVHCGATTSDDAFFSDRAQRPCGRFALLAQLLE